MCVHENYSGRKERGPQPAAAALLRPFPPFPPFPPSPSFCCTRTPEQRPPTPTFSSVYCRPPLPKPPAPSGALCPLSPHTATIRRPPDAPSTALSCLPLPFFRRPAGNPPSRHAKRGPAAPLRRTTATSTLTPPLPWPGPSFLTFESLPPSPPPKRLRPPSNALSSLFSSGPPCPYLRPLCLPAPHSRPFCFAQMHRHPPFCLWSFFSFAPGVPAAPPPPFPLTPPCATQHAFV